MDQIEALQRENAKLKLDISKLTQKKEEFYQRLLERRYDAKHKKVSVGITDLTNENMNAEIKSFDNFCHGVGQLLSYNSVSPKARKVIFAFGRVPGEVRLSGYLKVANDFGIEVIQLDGEGNETSLNGNRMLYESDPWKEYIQRFIQIDQSEAIAWSVLREHFRAWHDAKFEMKLSPRADEAKKYFDGKFKSYRNSHSKGKALKGFYGYKFVGDD